MPASSTSVISKYNSDKVPPDALPCPHINKKNSFSKKISQIENNVITKEKKICCASSLRKINNIFSSIMKRLSNKNLAAESENIELNRILSQGRALSHDAEIIHTLLNKPDITPSASPVLTTKMGLVLGGVLITGAVLGSSIYYIQRTGRKYHNDMSVNTTIGDRLSTSPISDNIHSPFNTNAAGYLHSELPETQDKSLISHSQENNTIKKQSLNIKLKRAKQIKRSYPCPSLKYNEKKILLKTPYYYTKRQPPACLTESFNSRCKKAHQTARNKKGCSFVPTRMVLKISGRYCLCPPPEWLVMKLIEPPFVAINRINRKKTPSIIIHQSIADKETKLPASVGTNNIRIIHTSDNEEIVKSRISDSYGYIVPPKIKPDTLPNITTSIPSTNEENQDVKPIDLLDCYNERENLTLSKKLRIISKTIDSPIATTLHEGLIVIKYDFLGAGCVNDTEFYNTVKKVEDAIDSLLSWIPEYNRTRLVTRIIAAVLDIFSDALDGNDINIDSLHDLNVKTLTLSKDVISSLNTRHINEIAESPHITKTKDIASALEYKKNNLMINIGNRQHKIKTQRTLNHLSDSESNNFVFYDHEKKWIIDDDIKSNDNIRKTFEKSREHWKDTENIFFFKNSSPDIYSNAIILRYHENIYMLIDNELCKTEEIQLTDNIFRYLIKDEDKSLPIIYKGEAWHLEESSSPSASKELHSFLINNNKIKNSLVSETISHQDVSPLTPGRDIQFDKNNNEYLKINNQYFMIKKSRDTSYYLEGSHDILALKMIDNQYYVKNSLFDDICCFHKEPLDVLDSTNGNERYFLDNTVISYLNSRDFLSNSQHRINVKDITDLFFKYSDDIDGAIVYGGKNYFYYNHNFIHVHSKGDGRYILGDINDDRSNIYIYKNTDDNVYFKIPKKTNKWHAELKKQIHCRVRKQPLSICNIDFIETDRVRYLLNENSNQRVTFDNPMDVLEPYENFHTIYKKKGVDNELYYKGIDNEYFHVRKNEVHHFSFTPSVFVIYGKNSDQQIALDYVITGISVMKDFDSQRMVYSTPEEAQENIFDIGKRVSDNVLKWQEEDVLHHDITSNELAKIGENTKLINDLSELNELFDRSGKKIITSTEYADELLKNKFNALFPSSIDDIEINSLKNLSNNKKHPELEEICNNAFRRVIENIKKSVAIIEESKEKLESYVLNVLKISDDRARAIFTSSLKNKLERMKKIFDEKNKENIIVIAKKSSETKKNFFNEKAMNLGFTISNDPLDRIFINAAFIDDIPEKISDPSGIETVDVPAIPSSPRRKSIYLTNLISDTMLHEAVHVLGIPEDYLYLNVNSDGYIDKISESITNIEEAIIQGRMESIKFEFLSKLYFKSNPLYKDITIKSLTKPNTLIDIFRKDSFFRAIVLLNNPDTISLLIREFAGSSLLDEEINPEETLKEPAPPVTNK